MLQHLKVDGVHKEDINQLMLIFSGFIFMILLIMDPKHDELHFFKEFVQENLIGEWMFT